MSISQITIVGVGLRLEATKVGLEGQVVEEVRNLELSASVASHDRN
jgi:hypothetical protein